MDNLYLNFRVRHQNITRMDFIKVVSGSQNYVKAKFNFSDDWAGLTKTARFTCNEESFDLILEQDECMIPWEVIKESGFFDVSVFGGSLITVDVARVYVTESGYAEGGSPLPPTPSVYEQIIDKLNEIEAEFSIEGIQKTVDEFLATKDFITEEDVEVIVERILATKDYATKNDISDLATKDDIKDFITEEQVTPIAEEVFEAHKSEFVGVDDLDGTTIYKGDDNKIHAQGGGINHNLISFCKNKVWNKSGRAEGILIDGKYIYATIGKFVCKIDASVEYAPTVVKYLEICPTGADATDLPSGGLSAFYNNASSFICKNIACSNDYIVVSMRHNSGAKADGVLLFGGFAIINKTDFTVTKSVWTISLNTGCEIYNNNILAIGNQIWGISFYNISTPTSPRIMAQFEYRYKLDGDVKVHEGYPNFASLGGTTIKAGHESQYGKFVKTDNNLYYVDIGFGTGFHIYDLTSYSDIKEVAEWKQQNNPIFDGTTASSPQFHTMECVIDYPYMYITCARTTSNDATSSHCGVITFDLTDIANPIWIDKCLINESDIEVFVGGTDPAPTHIAKNENLLYLDYETSVLIFEISEDKKSCKYIKKYNPNGSVEVLDIDVSADGRIVMGGKDKPYPSKLHIYRGF